MLTLLPASYRPSSLSTSDTILFVMRDKKGGAFGSVSLSQLFGVQILEFSQVLSRPPRELNELVAVKNVDEV
jgi:hypothetical protein